MGDGGKMPTGELAAALMENSPSWIASVWFQEPLGAGYCHDAGVQAQISAESQQTFHLKLHFILNVTERLDYFFP